VKVPASLGELGVLIEPASSVAKAWEQVGRVSARCASYTPRRVLVTGAGPIGLLAALLGVHRGYQVDVLDRALDGPKPALVRELGARYVTGPRNSIVCLTGVSSGARKLTLAASAFNNEVVLENDLVLGTVNANRRHYTQAVEALTQAEPTWLSRLITRRVPLSPFRDAITRQKHDVKVVLDLRV
jgi:threonine dehydrogenase-like Zn-dependent dehydrogenase